jgi:hypothetical protein
MGKRQCGKGAMDLIHLIQDSVQWCAFVNMIMNLQVHKASSFFSWTMVCAHVSQVVTFPSLKFCKVLYSYKTSGKISYI